MVLGFHTSFAAPIGFWALLDGHRYFTRGFGRLSSFYASVYMTGNVAVSEAVC
jgi:hypothetical protein